MSTIDAVVDMIKEFLTELSKTYPEHEKVKMKLKEIEDLDDGMKESFFNQFNDDIKEYSHYISKKSPKLFKKSAFFQAIDMEELWKIDVDDETKEAIWKYINTIHLLCTTLSVIPKDLMSNIEKMAQECATNMTNSDTNDLQNIDFASLMSGMQNIMGNMGGNMGNLGNMGKDFSNTK
jgi:hypothetical protein